MAAIDSELIDHDKVGNARHGVVAPLRSFLGCKSSEQTSKDHDDISNNGNENVGSAQAAEKRQIQQQEWGGDAPIDVTGPVDFTMNDVVGVGQMLLSVLDLDLVHGDTVTNSHGVVGDHGKGCNESRQDVEHAFLLVGVSFKSS